MRERKKRGKASRKETARQEQAATASGHSQSPHENSSEGPSPTQTASSHDIAQRATRPSTSEPTLQSSTPLSMNTPTATIANSDTTGQASRLARNDKMGQIQEHIPTYPSLQRFSNNQEGFLPDPTSQYCGRHGSRVSPAAISLNGFSLSHDYERPGIRGMTPIGGLHSNANGLPVGQLPSQMSTQQNFQGFCESAYPPISPPNLQALSPSLRFGGGTGESPLTGFFGTSPIVGSPGWLNLPSPSHYQQDRHHSNSINTLRFPILRPLLPYIESIIPVSLACDLLELYFDSSSTTQIHPISPYILGYVFRKQSFLHRLAPRACSPALLSSMLLLAAQTSDSPFLTSPPSARSRVCQKLLEITIALLKPLVHGPPAGESYGKNDANPVINGVALGGLGVAMTGGDQLTADGGATGLIDNVATYIHLAVLVSASEYKAASMRWWNIAWTLARELKLARELPPDPEGSETAGGENLGTIGVAENMLSKQAAARANVKESLPANVPGAVSEERREERRRVWWLLYTVDRHLALCYNRPLFLLDVECQGLLQPINDVDWQAGNFYGCDASIYSGLSQYRTRGPNFLCTGHSIFGYFTPLMTILGYIIELNQARSHPKFGQSSRNAVEWHDQAADITSQLEAYGQSLKEFEARFAANANEANKHEPASSETSAPSVASGNSPMTDAVIQTKIVVAYGTHIMHVLRVLIFGKWDPIDLLDDNDLWISSPDFGNATGHAISAANAISDILEYDPDLSFMPWFFGISLLQGGFLLLLMADKLAGQAEANLVRACENLVRAHEACIVTLNTEYQVSSLYPLSLPNNHFPYPGFHKPPARGHKS